MSIGEELKFLQNYPHFSEKPASILEFLGPGYCNTMKKMRPALVDLCIEIFGEEVNGERIARYERGISTGAIGIGKTTLASIVLPYMAHWTLCLADPQDYYDLMAGSRIAFMQMSTSAKQAKGVVFGDVKARIQNCAWFMDLYPYDKSFKNELRFDQKDVWILPGDSQETTFEGYNILGGILDEADSHQVTDVKDYAEQGYDTIQSRIESRFEERGFLLVIGQMKKANGFAATKYNEMMQDPKAVVSHMTIWESFGWDRYTDDKGNRMSFWFDTKKYEIVPPAAVEFSEDPDSNRFLEIPLTFQQPFIDNPVKALRDLAGIPPATGSPFIYLVDRITAAQDKYVDAYEIQTPVDPEGRIDPVFVALDRLPRAAHVDIAYSPNGDNLGFAMGHCRGFVEIEGESKPYIVIDLAMRIHAPPGRELFLGDIRQMIYNLKYERKFKITSVTTDGFESTDMRQQLEKRRIATDIVSVDRKMAPYYDLRDAIYEGRIEFPRYMVRYRVEDTKMTNVIYKELSELGEDKKIDHPPNGSKDVADSMAAVVHVLMGDRTYHRRRSSLGISSPDPSPISTPTGMPMGGPGVVSAPLPPSATLPVWNNRGRNG